MRKDDRTGDEAFDVRRREDAGRNKRAAAMTVEDRSDRAAKQQEARKRKKEVVLFVAKEGRITIVLVR